MIAFVKAGSFNCKHHIYPVRLGVTDNEFFGLSCGKKTKVRFVQVVEDARMPVEVIVPGWCPGFEGKVAVKKPLQPRHPVWGEWN